MANAMDVMKAKLLARKEKLNNRESGQQSSGGDNASYRFWDMKDGQTATIRFLPDADQDNPFFWVERTIIRLPFDGIVGGEYATNKPVTVTVPCVHMFGLKCPIINATRSWWDDESKKDLARQYYKKKSYLFQGFVVNSPFEEKNLPENPVRRFVINQSIYDIIEGSLLSMEDMPTDYVGGRDFKIVKTRRGEYANYSTSNWSFNTRSLGVTENSAIEEFGLYNLKDYLGKVPDEEGLEIIKAMFESSLAGDPFDTAQFGQHYRAYGNNNKDDDIPVTAPVKNDTVTKKVVVEEDVDTDVTDEVNTPVISNTSKSSAADVIAKIKARTAKV